MASTPLVIVASARKNSNTKKFVDTVFTGIDHNVIDLLDFKVTPYDYLHTYPEDDSFLKIIEEILLHKTIVFATPVYWYSHSGTLKIFLDRFTDLLKVHKDHYKKLKGKSVFLLAVGSDATLPDGFEIPFKLTSKYFGMRFGGCIYSPSSVMRTFSRQEIQVFTDQITEAK